MCSFEHTQVAPCCRTRRTVTQTRRKPGHTSRGARAVFLVGFMGAGKTTVGLTLSQRLGWRFVDLDRQIEARAGKTIAAIFQELGEPAFRQMETEALAKLLHALDDGDPSVIALGGGAFAQPANQSMLADCGARVVFLDAPSDELRRRLGQSDRSRPLFADAERFQLLYEERQHQYRRAPYRIQTSGKTVAEVALEIECLLGES